MNHTKGEWKVEFLGNAPKVATEDTLICDCTINDIVGKEEAKVNAKLIAAAPKMLKALQDIIADTPITNWNRSLIKQAKNALPALLLALCCTFCSCSTSYHPVKGSHANYKGMTGKHRCNEAVGNLYPLLAEYFLGCGFLRNIGNSYLADRMAIL